MRKKELTPGIVEEMLADEFSETTIDVKVVDSDGNLIAKVTPTDDNVIEMMIDFYFGDKQAKVDIDNYVDDCFDVPRLYPRFF